MILLVSTSESMLLARCSGIGLRSLEAGFGSGDGSTVRGSPGASFPPRCPPAPGGCPFGAATRSQFPKGLNLNQAREDTTPASRNAANSLLRVAPDIAHHAVPCILPAGSAFKSLDAEPVESGTPDGRGT